MTSRSMIGFAALIVACSAAGAMTREEMRDMMKKVADALPARVQLPVVTVVEFASSIDRRAAAGFREYVTRERRSQDSVFECFRLLPARSMREAKEVAAQKGACFILRVQMLRRVLVDKSRNSTTGEMTGFYNSDARLELSVPSTSRAAPKGSWKVKSKCLVRNYSSKSPKLYVLGGHSLDTTDKLPPPLDFGVIGGKILAYLLRSVLEVKRITVERAPGGGASARVEIVNRASIPIEAFSLDLAPQSCYVRYRPKDHGGKRLPPGENTFSVAVRHYPGEAVKMPPNGPCKGKVNGLSFGEVEAPAREGEAAAPKHRGERQLDLRAIAAGPKRDAGQRTLHP